jgi:hypothetical protein
MGEPWPSTKALSVYNALSLARRDMTRAGILEYLREAWDPDVPADFVATGVDFLLERGFVREEDGAVVPRERRPNGFCRPLRRIDGDANLDWAEAS